MKMLSALKSCRMFAPLGVALIGLGAIFSSFYSSKTVAMPSYARQTGLDCNSCHIGFNNVPLFTRTGRLFILRGFHQPNSVAGKFREDGFDAAGNDTPTYGGNYLALNWQDFFSGRFISNVASGGTAAGTGKNLDVTSNPGSRFSMYFTGPVTDWLGLWTEIGYLGNNAQKAVNTSSTAGQAPGDPTNLNYFAFDEYRLTASKMIGKTSFLSLAYGNEYPDAINEFVFPVNQVKPWSYGQGGVGREYSTAALSGVGFFADSILAQYSVVSGDADPDWSNGHNTYIALAYDGIPGTGSHFRRESNDNWFVFEGVAGNNVGSQVNATTTNFLCTSGVSGTCPAGVSPSNFTFTNTIGQEWPIIQDLAKVNTTGIETVRTSTAWRVSWHQAVADMGNNSWFQSVAFAHMNQSYISGASSTQERIGYTMRYFFNRTYGGEVYINKQLHYDYTTSSGIEYRADAPTRYGVTALWAPAMNINVSASFSPSRTPVLLAADEVGHASSWSVLIDYGF
jgi:hypothetical protein